MCRNDTKSERRGSLEEETAIPAAGVGDDRHAAAGTGYGGGGRLGRKVRLKNRLYGRVRQPALRGCVRGRDKRLVTAQGVNTVGVGCSDGGQCDVSDRGGGCRGAAPSDGRPKRSHSDQCAHYAHRRPSEGSRKSLG